MIFTRDKALRIPDAVPGARISSTAALPSKSSRKRDSTITEIRRSGRQSFSRRSVGVRRMMSPIDLRRIIRMRAPGGKAERQETTSIRFQIRILNFGRLDGRAPGLEFKRDSFGFNFCVLDNHVRNIVVDGINAPALRALQTFTVSGKFYGQLTCRANQYIQQFLRYSHVKPPLSQCISPQEQRRNSRTKRLLFTNFPRSDLHLQTAGHVMPGR
jgi:hypothetical protein